MKLLNYHSHTAFYGYPGVINNFRGQPCRFCPHTLKGHQKSPGSQYHRWLRKAKRVYLIQFPFDDTFAVHKNEDRATHLSSIVLILDYDFGLRFSQNNR
jgi:hypothetical protein